MAFPNAPTVMINAPINVSLALFTQSVCPSCASTHKIDVRCHRELLRPGNYLFRFFVTFQEERTANNKSHKEAEQSTTRCSDEPRTRRIASFQ
jgi:hypothetical protein